MIAYHGDAALKRSLLAKVARHRKLDQLVQGTGAEGEGASFRGCAVGCTLGTYDHALYPDRLGVPVQLAYLEDRIFERLSRADAMKWPGQFLRAIPNGADLSLVWPRSALWLLTVEMRRWATITKPVADMYRRVIKGDHPAPGELAKVRGQAWSVRAKAADAAAGAAADAAADAAAYAAAAAAAYAAAYAYADADAAAAAAAAAYAAAYAYAATAAAAAAATATAAATAAARKAFWLRSSAKLIELLKAAPVSVRV